MQNKKFDRLTRIGELPSRIYIILGLIMMGINTILCVFVSAINPAICGAVFIALYGIISLIIYFVFHRKLNTFRNEKYASDEQAGSVIYAFRNQLSLPYAVVNEKGKIITSNDAFANALGAKDTIFNLSIDQLCNINLSELIKISEENAKKIEGLDAEQTTRPYNNLRRAEIAEFGGKKYRMESHQLSSKGKLYQMIVFFDITELSDVALLYKNSYAAVGYITVDNLDEIAQYVRVNYQDETRRVGKILREWATKMGGILCECSQNVSKTSSRYSTRYTRLK